MGRARSAGLLLYRRRRGTLEVLLVHPGGPYWKNRDRGAWTIPKGEIEEDETPRTAARREFREELGLEPPAELRRLEPVVQKGGKEVLAWAAEGDCDPAAIDSEHFSMEWPPDSGRRQSFPEVDRAEFFTLDEARERINPAQVDLLEQLEALLGEV